jgi:hypothetical protein
MRAVRNAFARFGPDMDVVVYTHYMHFPGEIAISARVMDTSQRCIVVNRTSQTSASRLDILRKIPHDFSQFLYANEVNTSN